MSPAVALARELTMVDMKLLPPLVWACGWEGGREGGREEGKEANETCECGERHARPSGARHLREEPGFGKGLDARASRQSGRRDGGEGGKGDSLSGLLTCVSSD